MVGGTGERYAEVISGAYTQIYEFPQFEAEGRIDFLPGGERTYRLNRREVNREDFLRVMSDDPFEL